MAFKPYRPLKENNIEPGNKRRIYFPSFFFIWPLEEIRLYISPFRRLLIRCLMCGETDGNSHRRHPLLKEDPRPRLSPSSIDFHH